MTRQSANILQDLTRRCQQAGSVSVLHGARGVGKSRLLMQFVDKYATDKTCFLIRFNRSGEFFAARKLTSRLAQDRFKEALLARIPEGAILLLDAFEYVGEALRHELFEFWLTQARAKNLKLVIAICSENLPELKQSAATFMLTLQSVALEPLTRSEQLALVQASCCTGAAQQLVLSARQKKQLDACGGLYPAVLDFMAQQGDTLDCQAIPLTSRASISWFRYVLVLSLVVGFFLAYRYVVVPMFQASATQNRQAVATVTPRHMKDLPKSLLNQTQQSDNARVPVHRMLRPVPVQKRRPAQTLRTSLAPSTDTPALVNTNPLEGTQQVADLFQQRLASTRDWLASAPRQASSIQLMTLQTTALKHQAINRYLQHLHQSQIDLDQIQIFPFWRNGQKMYGVLYGRYASVAEARARISQLPRALLADHPMVRTVQGIVQDWKKGGN